MNQDQESQRVCWDDTFHSLQVSGWASYSDLLSAQQISAESTRVPECNFMDSKQCFLTTSPPAQWWRGNVPLKQELALRLLDFLNRQNRISIPTSPLKQHWTRLQSCVVCFLHPRWNHQSVSCCGCWGPQGYNFASGQMEPLQEKLMWVVMRYTKKCKIVMEQNTKMHQNAHFLLELRWPKGNNTIQSPCFWKATVPGVSTPLKFTWNEHVQLPMVSNNFPKQRGTLWSPVLNDLRIRELVMSWHPRTDMLRSVVPKYGSNIYMVASALFCNGGLVSILCI